MAATDRLHAAWLLSFYGLRRGEVLGVFWESIGGDSLAAVGRPGGDMVYG